MYGKLYHWDRFFGCTSGYLANEQQRHPRDFILLLLLLLFFFFPAPQWLYFSLCVLDG